MQTWVNVNYFRGIMLVTVTLATKHDICHGLCYNGLCRKFSIFVSSNISSLVGQTKAYRPISFFANNYFKQKNSIVKFDEVSVNEGNHFNSGDGIFVAPVSVSGTYLFSWTTQTDSNHLAETELRVDNIVK
jgi:hypothetical protein